MSVPISLSLSHTVVRLWLCETTSHTFHLQFILIDMLCQIFIHLKVWGQIVSMVYRMRWMIVIIHVSCHCIMWVTEGHKSTAQMPHMVRIFLALVHPNSSGFLGKQKWSLAWRSFEKVGKESYGSCVEMMSVITSTPPTFFMCCQVSDWSSIDTACIDPDYCMYLAWHRCREVLKVHVGSTESSRYYFQIMCYNITILQQYYDQPQTLEMSM